MNDYKAKILEILKKSNGLPFSNIEVELLRTLSEMEKKEYKFEIFFTSIVELENAGLILRGTGGKYEKNKFYIKDNSQLKFKNSNLQV